MRSGLSGKIYLSLAAALVATLLAVAAVAGPSAYRTMRLGSGFTAQILCGGVFVSGRHPQHLLAEDLRGPGYERLRFFRSGVDRENKRVTASLYGLAAKLRSSARVSAAP